MGIPIAALAVGLGAGGLLAGGLLASRLRTGASLAQIFAGGLMLALVAVDLIPDALSDGREAHWPAAVVVGVFAVVAVLAYRVLRPRETSPGERSVSGSCCSPASGDFSSAGIALHGALEGMVLGLGLGLDTAAGPVLLCAFCLHKFGEGFALRVSLRSAGARRRRVGQWMALAALAPVVGACVGSTVSLNHRIVPLLTAALAAILVVVAVNLVSPTALGLGLLRRRALGSNRAGVKSSVVTAPLLRNWLSLIAGVTLMGIVTGLAG